MGSDDGHLSQQAKEPRLGTHELHGIWQSLITRRVTGKRTEGHKSLHPPTQSVLMPAKALSPSDITFGSSQRT